MDLDGLRNELEKHLAKNPDPHAPQGFRDRFEAEVAKYQSDETDIPKSVREAELERIRNEAEAAANAATMSRAEAPEQPMARNVAAVRAEAPEQQVATADPATETVDAHVNPPQSGGAMGYVFGIVAIVVVLAAAYYFFRR